MVSPQEVLEFWFGDAITDEASVTAKLKLWFGGGPAVDDDIRSRFGAAVEAAIAGELDSWADTPRSRLALVILLDQFTRNVYRNDPRTYSGDTKAQTLSLEAFDRGLDRELSVVEKMFLAMPLLHSERVDFQRRSVELSRARAAEAPPFLGKMAAMHVEQAAKYLDIIQRYGRFPHRNELLGRPSTDDEKAFLVDWAQKAPPKGAPRSSA